MVTVQPSSSLRQPAAVTLRLRADPAVDQVFMCGFVDVVEDPSAPSAMANWLRQGSEIEAERVQVRVRVAMSGIADRSHVPSMRSRASTIA